MAARGVLLFACLLAAGGVPAQYTLRGVVSDATSGETLIGATVVLKGTTTGTTTDVNGRFELRVSELPPFTLVVSFVGYQPQEIEVKSIDQELKFKLSTDQVLLQQAEVTGSRISEKQKQAPLTVESMDIIAIREAPSGDFYESLGTLKGVDMTAASFGFKVINTRGFNSTSPVRSLQLIDGVDNQSPGLNFSLGNFLGACDLDLMKVDVIAGASTAYYGPGAFNGVIAMTTKSPWMFPGLSVSAKAGERGLLEGCVRWAKVFKDDAGKDSWAYKVNAFAMRADDWPVSNYDPTINSPTGVDNPGRYDAVNIYGDEDVAGPNSFFDQNGRIYYPGLRKYLRDGYTESELVDYKTHNVKLNGALHWMATDSIEAIASSSFSTGSTVYQGDNRYRLKDVLFFQHRLEVREKDRWFLRGYFTHEDAGETYDIFTTAIRLQDEQGKTGGANSWNTSYSTLWGNWITPQINALPGYVTASEAVSDSGWTQAEWYAWQDQWYADNNALLTTYHQQVLDSVNLVDNGFLDPKFEPGTERFDTLFAGITSRLFTEGGSMFYDRSALAHAMGEYRFKIDPDRWTYTGRSKYAGPSIAELVVGASFRQYLPDSRGTIFRDTGDVVIRNSEYGVYAGIEKKAMDDKLRATLTLRMDKNQNFDHLFSPAASLVWLPKQDQVVRVSFSSAIRNPTLADQYLFYNVGRAYLLGNVEGQFEEGNDSLVTIDSFKRYRQTLLPGDLDYFNVDRIRPEQAKTIEFGYRGTIRKNWYLDAGYFHSWYTDFIGYVIGLRPAFYTYMGTTHLLGLNAYRLAANATGEVRTQGVNAGLSHYRDRLTYGINWSWNVLSSGEDDPIIPAFNTPEIKYNLSLTAHDWRIPWTTRQHLGWGVNYKYVQGYTFEGSPQFTGDIPTYDMLDAQVNVLFPKAHTTVKVGASNLLGLQPLFDDAVPDDEKLERVFNNEVLLVFGGPYVGRLAYVQLIYEFTRR